ncbi:hypothetical protein JCM10213v2_005429, partial [Rhodosporidiobolus nylandii]
PPPLPPPSPALPSASLSPVTYCAYNSGALDACQDGEANNETGRQGAVGANVFAWGRTIEEAVSTINARIIPKLEEWFVSHNTVFEPTKTAAVLFLPQGKKQEEHPLPVLP